MWGDDWGSMIWAHFAAVPSMGALGGACLLGSLLAVAAIAHWSRIRSAKLPFLLFLPLALAIVPFVAVGQVTVPNTFVNGTVADADQVNENFVALVAELNALADRVALLEGQGLTAAAGKPAYTYGEPLQVGGQSTANDSVTFAVRNPVGALASVGQAQADGAGLFGTTLLNFPPAPNGTFPVGNYEVEVNSALLGLSETVTFSLSE